MQRFYSFLFQVFVPAGDKINQMVMVLNVIKWQLHGHGQKATGRFSFYV
ncbi:MAG: hypothetical protein RIG77_25035 [Cyclobacteriaceae bacterium]